METRTLRRLAGVGLVSALLLFSAAAPAGDSEVPLQFITGEELKALMDKNGKVDVIDVRTWDEYVKRHIKGARSVPIRAIPSRAQEISKTGLVVLY